MNGKLYHSLRAFTLIELLVVVAIIALLLSILLPSLAKAREQAKKAVCLSNLHHCGNGFSTYSIDHKGVLPMRGGFNYNIKEPENYHLKNGVARAVRVTVNYGALYGKYCGKEGVFYFCPGNVLQDYTSRSNGWITFLANKPTDPDYPYAGVTWGGYCYATPVLPGNSPVEDPVIRGTTSGIDANYPDRAPGAWKQVTQPSAVNEGLPWQKYGVWLASQLRQRKNPYIGRLQALMTDQLVISLGKGDRFSHLGGVGQNVLFTDYHAKWVTDPTGTIIGLSYNPGMSSGPGGQPGLYAAWNFLSRRN